MQTDTLNHEEKRIELAVNLRSRAIDDENVLCAVRAVPRHLFFPNDSCFPFDMIYEDVAIPIGKEQTMPRTHTAAYQAQALKIQPRDKVLEIGTGSGYLAALLCEMGADVYTVERIGGLFRSAKNVLRQQLEYKNISCFLGDGYTGLPEWMPFDKIIVTVYVPDLPTDLLKQLRIGGILVLPFRSDDICHLVRITKHGVDAYESEDLPERFMFSPLQRGFR
ncbi:MAG: protein-L-isoaspartate O-methyltransferase [Bacteroidota bacterium]